MIKAVLFDLDGVLTKDQTGSLSIVRYLSRRTGLAFEQLSQVYSPFNPALLNGRITHQDMWPAFCAQVGVNIPFELLEDSFRSTPMDAEMIALVHELKVSHLIGMITDNKADRVETILQHFDLKALFDAVAISAQIGSGKDNEVIFHNILNALGIQPEEAVFIDNSPKNLLIPEHMGMRTILFDDEKRDIAALRRQICACL